MKSLLGSLSDGHSPSLREPDRTETLSHQALTWPAAQHEFEFVGPSLNATQVQDGHFLNCSSDETGSRPGCDELLKRASRNVWQTSPLLITSNLILAKLSSSSSRGKTALAWTCQSLSRMSPYRLHWWSRNLDVILDDRLSFTPNITAVARSCRDTSQLLVQALVISRLDYCNSLLAGLSTFATKPLQRIQNGATRLFYKQLPKFSHVTHLLHDLHWLPVVAHIVFKTMVLAFKGVDGTAPVYLQTLSRQHSPTRALRFSTSAGRLVTPSLRANKVQGPAS